MNEQGSPIIVGIHGAIENGKSTLADILREIEPNSLYYESSTIISEVLEQVNAELSEPLPDDRLVLINQLLTKLPPILKKTVHVDTDIDRLTCTQAEIDDDYPKFSKLFAYADAIYRQPELLKDPITPENKESYRPGLQGLGGYLVSKVCETIWYDEIVRRMHNDITPDTRLVVVGGLRFPSDESVLRAEGARIIEIVRYGQVNRDERDPTEKYRKLIHSDSRIFNIGSIDDLRTTTKLFYEDLTTDSLQPTYITEVDY